MDQETRQAFDELTRKVDDMGRRPAQDASSPGGSTNIEDVLRKVEENAKAIAANKQMLEQIGLQLEEIRQNGVTVKEL